MGSVTHRARRQASRVVFLGIRSFSFLGGGDWWRLPELGFLGPGASLGQDKGGVGGDGERDG